MDITAIWNTVFFQPMLNGVILLYGLLFRNFGLTIVVFTILVRLVILPLTLRQLHASKALSRVQPEMSKIQKKYAGDRQRISQEQMRLYKEHGINPLGCAVPTLIQFPVWIGLYQSILKALAATPGDLMELSRHLYPSLPQVQQMVPLESHFLWLDLGQPDDKLVLPLLVMGSMWVQQKMMTMPTDDPRQQQMNSTMQWMMPIMFGFFTMQFASGLAIYWFVSNVISIVIQYFVTGWGSLTWFQRFTSTPSASSSGRTAESAVDADTTDGVPPEESTVKRQTDGKSRSKRKVSRRGR